MGAFFLKLVNLSIASGWLVLAVLLLRALFRRAPKWIFCLLWGLAALRLICPISLESPLSLVPNARPLPVEAVYPEMSGAVTEPDGELSPGGTVAPAGAEGMSVRQEAAEKPALRVGIDRLSLVWAAVAAAMLLYALISYLLLKRRLAAATRLTGNIRQSERIASPFVLGFFRPVIYLPYAAAEADLPYILAHERAHIRRGDHWWKPLSFILLAVYWFDPLLWIAYAAFCRDIEAACDEKVIRAMNRKERRAYSTALFNCSVRTGRFAAGPLAFGEEGVKARVKRVMDYRKPAFWVVVLACAAAAVTAVCLMTDPVREDGNASERAAGTDGSETAQTAENVAAGSAAGGQPSESQSSDVQPADGTSPEDLLVWSEADLDHDGENETVRIRQDEMVYEISVEKADGTVLWSTQGASAHTAWNTVLICEEDGEDYLIRYQPAMFQGMGSYRWTMFSLEGGGQREADAMDAEFQLPVEMNSELREFAERTNRMLENSTLLFTSEQGDIVIGPVAATEVPQIYPVHFDPAEIYETASESENVSVPFADGQPLEFLFASGAGGWGTTLTLYPDGSFEGIYEDGENDAGPGYPRGTTYVCEFTGRFGEMTKLTDHTYVMKLEALDYDEPGREWIEDEIRNISAEPYGLVGGEDFALYVPETPADALKEEFRSWWPDEYLWRAGTLQTLSCYGLYNTDTGQGFFTSHD